MEKLVTDKEVTEKAGAEKVLYLVTGAAGFLGGHVCRQLIERGENVRAFALPNDKAIKYIPKGVEVVEGDLCNIDDVRRFFAVEAGVETICLHIASVVTVSPEYNPLVMNVNVGGTKNIIRCCKEHKECKKLVYCSSTGAIPEEKKGRRIREVMYFDEDQTVGCYSRSKAIATQAVLDAAMLDGLNACVVHPSGILGPEDPAVGETTGTVIDIINGQMPMGIDGSFNLCDVRDLAAGLISAADRGKQGECYILANEEVTFRDFCKILCEESGCKPIKRFLSLGLAYKLSAFMEKMAAKSGKTPLMTTFSVYNLARNNTFDYSKATRELGYTTRPYAETIRDEIIWLKENGKIK